MCSSELHIMLSCTSENGPALDKLEWIIKIKTYEIPFSCHLHLEQVLVECIVDFSLPQKEVQDQIMTSFELQIYLSHLYLNWRIRALYKILDQKWAVWDSRAGGVRLEIIFYQIPTINHKTSTIISMNQTKAPKGL